MKPLKRSLQTAVFASINKRSETMSLTQPLVVPTGTKQKSKKRKPETMHVDVFIDHGLRFYGGEEENEKYARWVLNYFRSTATLIMDFREFMEQYKLFCTYEGKRYRVIGASRMGDIWLVAKFDVDHGYDLRVDPMKCSAWGKVP
jgi:hypothetical protein